MSQSPQIGGFGEFFLLELFALVDLVVQGGGGRLQHVVVGGCKGRSGEGLMGNEKSKKLVGDLHD